MNKSKRPVLLLSVCCFAALLTALLIAASGYFVESGEEARPVQRLNAVTVSYEGKTEQLKLPHSLSDLPARTPVTVTLDVTPKQGDCLYIKTVYAPLKLYANDALIYEYGADGTYPSFMADPATAVEIVHLPAIQSTVHLRLEFLSPSARDTLTIHQILLGSSPALVRHLCRELGFSFSFAVLLIFGGLILLLISLFIIRFEPSGIVILYLGIFALLAGFWAFGECNLTELLIRNPTLLYILAFSGLFLLPVPIISFGLTVINFHSVRPLRVIQLLIVCAASAALLLQLTGLIPFEKSMYLFHVLLPLSLCMFAGHVLYESIHNREPTARRFLLPMAVLALFSVLEAVNYQAHFTYVLSLFFQIGVLIFIFLTGINGASFIRNALRIKNEEQRLKYEMKLMEYRLEEQAKHQQLLLDNQEAVRAQRHDLRHQLAVLRRFSEEAGNEKITDYLDGLVAAIPTEQGRFYCENEAVNAIVSHYAARAEAQGVTLTVSLTVPRELTRIPDSSLCVVFGNLLENAVEACERMQTGERFIRLRSRLQYGTLTIAMDNSFDGSFTVRDGSFVSSKRREIGTGLQSVRAIAEKFCGGARFEAQKTVFLSSVYLRVCEE